MRDPVLPSTNDHPLRETWLAWLDEDERDALVIAAALVDSALLQYTKGGSSPIGPRKTEAIARDLQSTTDHATETVRSWQGVHSDRHPDERAALENALPHLRAALDALAPVMEGAGTRDAPAYSPERCRRLAEDFQRTVLDFARQLDRFPEWEPHLRARDPEHWWFGDNAVFLRKTLFGGRDGTPEEPARESLLWDLTEVLDTDEQAIRSRMEQAARDCLDASDEGGADAER